MFSDQHLQAQTDSIAGEYALTGVMETASGLLLNRDSTFQFFFSYGALDRYGSGKWSVHDNNVMLDSKPYPGRDFKIVDSSFVKNGPVTIKIEGANTNLYGLVYCLVKRTTGIPYLMLIEMG